jgi:hypothetical protein
MPEWTHHRARVAALSRDRAVDDPELVAARRALAAARLAAKLEEQVQRLVDAAPALTAEQRQRLALLLRPPGAGAK